MASASDLFLGGVAHRARVLPVVYLSILDHHLRRNQGEVRIGDLNKLRDNTASMKEELEVEERNETGYARGM